MDLAGRSTLAGSVAEAWLTSIAFDDCSTSRARIRSSELVVEGVSRLKDEYGAREPGAPTRDEM
jgi:hypothetical protein